MIPFQKLQTADTESALCREESASIKELAGFVEPLSIDLLTRSRDSGQHEQDRCFTGSCKTLTRRFGLEGPGGLLVSDQ